MAVITESVKAWKDFRKLTKVVVGCPQSTLDSDTVFCESPHGTLSVTRTLTDRDCKWRKLEVQGLDLAVAKYLGIDWNRNMHDHKKGLHA
jgi:hypothetical protein